MPNSVKTNRRQARLDLNLTLKRKSREFKEIVQSAINDFAREVAREASESVVSGHPAEGLPKGEIKKDKGALDKSYYTVTHGNGTTKTNYAGRASKVGSIAGPDKVANKGTDRSYPITSRTRRLYARIGSAATYGNYWEYGHYNKYITGAIGKGRGGFDGKGKYVRASVIQDTLDRKKHELEIKIREKLKLKGVNYRGEI